MSSNHRMHPPTLPPITELPPELRPLLTHIYRHQTQACLLSRTIQQYEAHISKLREKRRCEEKHATELQIKLWDSLGKIEKLPPGPKIRKHFPKEFEDPEITTEARAIEALKKMSDEERSALLMAILEQQRSTAAKEGSE
jgi:hypothetical protein